MDVGCAVLLLDSEKAEEIYTYAYPNKELAIGKDVHSSALLLLGMKDLMFQITSNEIYLASFQGLRALYTKLTPNFVLVLLHSASPTFQYLHSNFARDLARWVEFQIGPDWPTRVSGVESASLHRELDAIFSIGICRFGAQGTDYAWTELVGGGVCEGAVVGEASEAQLCEAVASMEVGCTTKQHLVSADIGGISVVGTCIFAGTKLVYTTLNSNLARQVWEWLAVQQAIPDHRPPHSQANQRIADPLLTRKSTHAEWQKIAQVFPSPDFVMPNPRYAQTYALAALAQEEFVVCVLIQAGAMRAPGPSGPKGPTGGPSSPTGWVGNDLRGAIVMDEIRGLLHSLRAAGTLARIRKQLSANSPQLFPSSDLPYLLTPSPEITLFHFVAHNQITGVVMYHTAVNPIHIPLATPHNITTPLEVLFVKTSEKIRKLMISNGAHEHGVRVTLGEEQYWVVGRSSLQGTFFACYSSQAPQSVVEMAFKAQFFSNQFIQS